MRDLYANLKLLSTEHPMDYCQEFDLLKSIFDYVDRCVRPFSTVSIRGGCEPFINELNRLMLPMLVDNNLIDPEWYTPLETAHKTLRKITMLLLLNTDLIYKYNLNADPNISHVVGLLPKVPTFVSAALVWDFCLDAYFAEALSYTPIWFSFQWFSVANDSLKYVNDPYKVLMKLEYLLRALNVSISRYELREIDLVDRKKIFNKLYDSSMEMMRHFNTPDMEKLKRFTKKQKYKYLGYVIKHILNIVLHAMDLYEEKEEADNPQFDLKIYEIFADACKIVPRRKNRVKPAELTDQQMKIIMALLNVLQTNLMQVKMDTFVYWVSVPEPNKSQLQMVVGELIYNLRERLTHHDFDHDVVALFRHFAIKPRTFDEIVSEATLGEVLLALDVKKKPAHERQAWFNELLNRNIAFGNDECLESIQQNLELMNVANCMKILDFIKMHMTCLKTDAEELARYKMNDDDIEELAAIVLSALPKLDQHQILELLVYKDKQFEFCDSFFKRTTKFNARSTEYLNKYNTAAAPGSSQFALKSFLILCFEQPLIMWQKFFDRACDSAIHTANFCAIVRQTKPFSDIYFEKMLIKALQDNAKAKLKYFPTLICDVYMSLYMEDRTTEFFQQIIHKTVETLLEDAEKFDSLLPIVKALNLIATHGKTDSNKPLHFREMCPPVLVMVGNIMDKVRWDLITYTTKRDEILRECIQFVECISNRLLPVISETDRRWVVQFYKSNFRNLTQFYFQKFALTDGEAALDFDRFLISEIISTKNEAVAVLLKLFIRCTTKESEWLLRNPGLQPYLAEAMITLSQLIEIKDIYNPIENYQHCLANYAHIIRNIFLPQIENDTLELQKLQFVVLKVLAATPAIMYDEAFLSYQSLLLEMLNKCHRPISYEFKEHLLNIAADMRDCQGKKIYLERITAFVAATKHSSDGN